jgi:thiol-disulfide isomerase/thioredoxin
MSLRAAHLLSLAVLTVLAACNPSPKINQDAPTTPTSAVAASTTAATTASAPPSATAAPDAAMRETGVRVVLASQDTDALTLVRTERLKAKAEGRVLVVYAGATWCEPCKRFKEEVHTGRLDGQLPRVTLLAFDADRDTDRLGAAGYKFSFIPFVALPGADGHPTDTQEARGKGSNAWRELIAKLEAWEKKGP